MGTTRFGPLAETPQQYFPHTDRANATFEAALVDFEGTKRERRSSLHSVRPNHPYRSGLPKPRTAHIKGVQDDIGLVIMLLPRSRPG
jgi:hypothetical protein